MRLIFLVISALAAVANAQAPTELVHVTGMTIKFKPGRKGAIMTLVDIPGDESGQDNYCRNDNPQWPNPKAVVTCLNDVYNFAFHPGTNNNNVRLRLYHNLDHGKMRWGEVILPIYCDGTIAAGDTCYLTGQGNVPLTLRLGEPPSWP